MLKLADKDRRTVTIMVFHMFKKLEKRMHILSGDAEDKKKKKDLNQCCHKLAFCKEQCK